MNPDLFVTGDSALLLGEGNFSFAVDLVKLNLPITITATCFETELVFDSGKDNFSYLEQKGVRVLLGVDATKLAENPVLGQEKFSKIVFNFPHVGGKMKIHLNRKLVRHFFQSATQLITDDGKVLVSLCKGQGGTRFDQLMRRWDDTWQIVEMAAYGNFVLVDVEPFRTDILQNYASVGYRGGSAAFHTDGALVHVFCKRQPLYEDEFHVLNKQDVHEMKRLNNPFMRSDSIVSYFCERLKMSIGCNHKMQQLGVETPLNSVEDMQCLVFEFAIRHLRLWNEDTDNIVLYPALALNGLGSDFSLSPLSCLIFLLGCNVDMFELVQDYLNDLLVSFEKDALVISSSDTKHNKSTILKGIEIIIEYERVLNVSDMEVGHVYSVMVDSTSLPLCIIHPERLAKLLFDINWRQIWAEHAAVVNHCGIPVFKCASLETRSYSLDISFLVSQLFSEERFYKELWDYTCDIITRVKLLSVYNSPDGWISRCYRITYQSFDKPFNRDKAIYIQQNIVAQILSTKLGVTVR